MARRAKPRKPCERCGGQKEPGQCRHLCDDCRAVREIELLAESRRKPCLRCGGRKDPGKRRRYCDACQEEAVRETRLARKKRDWDRNREKRTQSKREHYERNAAAIKAKLREQYMVDPEYWLSRSRAWREANPEQVRANHAKRRAMVRGAMAESIHALVVLERDDGLCGICGDDVDPQDFHVDHIVPLARGGLHTFANVQTSHPECNMRKGATTWHSA